MTAPAPVPRPPFDPAMLSVREHFVSYVAILDELMRRELVRTRNSPLGDLAENLAVRAYGGSLAPNSEKSYDLVADDGRRIQVKARTVLADDKRSQNFSAMRSWDFDAALFLLFDAATYDLVWARELDRDQTQALGRRVEQTNSSAVLVRDVAHVSIDETDLVRAAYDRIDEPAA